MYVRSFFYVEYVTLLLDANNMKMAICSIAEKGNIIKSTVTPEIYICIKMNIIIILISKVTVKIIATLKSLDGDAAQHCLVVKK